MTNPEASHSEKPASVPPAATETAEAPPRRRGCGCLGRLIALVGLVVMIGLVVGFLGALTISQEFAPPEEVSREVVVSIPQGATPSQIGDLLEQAGVVRSKRAFLWAYKIKTKISRKPLPLKAGEMALDPAKSVWETMQLLAKGNYKLYPFTVPEGWTMSDIARLAEKEGHGTAQDFLKLCRDKTFINSLGLETDSLEGYLFPETYNFPKGITQEKMIKTMVERFFTVWKKYAQAAQARGLSRHQALTLASIVEKETGAPEERPLIAGVFTNRLARGMRLETDPTVIYGLPNYSGTITKKDLATAHPYNTYIINGLPPGPIANPGELAIAAAVNPARVDYLFFVSKNDGTHYFSTNLAEHNRMVNKYQRQGRGATN